MEAVIENGNALQYIRDQTHEICMAAVFQDGEALRYVRNQTRPICMEAVKQNSSALQYVTNQTEEICRTAMREGGDVDVLRFVDKEFWHIFHQDLNSGYRLGLEQGPGGRRKPRCQ